MATACQILLLGPWIRRTAGKELRFLVVHSDRLVGRFDEALPDRLKREHESLQDRAKSQGTKGLACEEDARRAGARVAKAAHLHNATVEVQSEVRTLKRSRRGRPKAGEVAPTKTVWHFKLKLVPDEEATATARRKASCFVLITDWDAEEWTDVRVLEEYRHQSVIEGHTGFRWLKGPGAVAPVFLDTPTRIRALGLILILALMVRNHIQFALQGRNSR